MLVVEGFYLFEPSLPGAELHATLTDIIYARQKLQTERIFIDEDSAIIIGWIQGNTKQLEAHPLLCDI